MHLKKQKITLTISTSAAVTVLSTIFNGLLRGVAIQPSTIACKPSTQRIDITNEQSTDWRFIKIPWSTSLQVYYPRDLIHGSTGNVHGSTYIKGTKMPLCGDRIRARVLQGTTAHSVHLTLCVEGA